MKNYLAFLFLVVFIQLSAQNTLKYSDLKTIAKASIEDVAWIAGYWQGSALGGTTEELWTPPLGSSMMGSFKLVVDNEVQFYELCTITEENETLLLRIKHFNSDLKGWEEKDETEDFPLVKIEPNKVFFNNITFEKTSETSLNIYVIFKEDSGNETSMTFTYNLKK